MVTYLGSLVQFCCGEGRTPQRNITGMCGECSHCMDRAGFASLSICAFPIYTAQTPGCSAGELSKAGPVFHALPLSKLLSFRFLGKGTDSVGHAFGALPRSEQLRQQGAWRVHCPRWPVHLNHLPSPAAWFPRYPARVPSQVHCVSPLES